MKKLAVMILVCALCLASAAFAAEWADGRSPAQPYAGVPEVKLDETMGYIMLFPREKLPAERFCDVLEIYLPREDIVMGEGNVILCDEEGEILRVSCADSEHVELRPLEEGELEGLMWGGGVCIEVHLPVSLEFEHAYYVNMEEGCFSAAEGKVQSLPLTANDAWVPVLNGDFGIGGLYYSAAPEAPEAEEGEEAEEAAEEAAPAEPAEPKSPEKGDVITFNLKMGGDAKFAVVYSENDSVFFDPLEYTESGTVTGTITGDELDWGVVFLDENGEVLDVVELG